MAACMLVGPRGCCFVDDGGASCPTSQGHPEGDSRSETPIPTPEPFTSYGNPLTTGSVPVSKGPGPEEAQGRTNWPWAVGRGPRAQRDCRVH